MGNTTLQSPQSSSSGSSVRPLSRRSMLAGAASAGLVMGCASVPTRSPSYVSQILAPRHQSSVFHWLDIALRDVRDQRIGSPRAAYNYATPLVAGFLAVNSILHVYDTPYDIGVGPRDANPDIAFGAAFARAAGDVFQRAFTDELTAFTAQFPDGAAKSLGVKWGDQVGRAVITMRADDGSDPSAANYDLGRYRHRQDVMRWEPTGPFYKANPEAADASSFRGLFPGQGYIRPWTMKSRTQFRVRDFHAPRSPEFAEEFDRLRRIGGKDSTLRTKDQSNIALFWEDIAGGITSPGHFIYIAIQVLQNKPMDFIETARAFALLGMALCDASICSWDNKYHHDILRPETAIRRRARQFNNSDPRLIAQPDWESFIITPEFPAYTSGHSTFGAAGAEMTALLLGHDAVQFSGTSPDQDLWPTLKGVTRSWTSLSQVAEENGLSRIYGGVHWALDHTEAMRSGRALARQAFETMFPKKA